jgi:hypothetical protein
MIFSPFYYFKTGCAAYVFGCAGLGVGAVVDPQADDMLGGNQAPCVFSEPL